MKEVFETIFLLASIQGFLLSLVLLFRKENHSADIFLSLGILALSLELLTSVYYSKGWYRFYPWFMGITYSIAYLYGPLFYFYTKLLTKKIENIKLNAKFFLHFVPFIIGYFLLIPIWLLPLNERIEYVAKMIAGDKLFVYEIYTAFIPFQGIIYTVLTILLVVDYNKKIKERFSNTDRINLDWLKYLTIGMIICWSFSAFSQIMSWFILKDRSFEIALYTAISVLIYSIGYMGLKQPEIFMKPADFSDEDKQQEKYKKSGLDDAAAEEIKNKLLGVMINQKPYLDGDLTLLKLADMISVSGHHLSEVINSKLNKTYYDFVNEYRVEEFKNKLKDPSTRNYNLLSIAFESGFKSKTSFNTIFKKHTNQTPSEFKSSLNL